MTMSYYLFGIALFVAVVLCIEGAYLWWRTNRSAEARRLVQRLKSVSGDAVGDGIRASIFKQRVLSQSEWLASALERVPGVAEVDHLLLQSGLPWTVAYFAGAAIAAAVAGFFIGAAFHHPLAMTLAFSLACAFLPLLYVMHCKSKRLSRIEEQLPDAVDLIGRALRAGHPFSNAIKMVGDEMTQPIAGEFRMLFDEVNYGVSMQEALLNLSNRVPSTDLKYLVIAVLIQRESGGNLAELLDNISGIIRARLKLFGSIRVLSAEGRLSAWILSLLPFCTALMIQLVNPGFIRVLWTDAGGLKMIYAACGMMLIGVVWMRHIIRIRV